VLPLFLPTLSQERSSSWTYTSNVGIGGVLSQVRDGQEHVIAYYSKMLNKAERNYCVTQRELPAIVRTMEHFLQEYNFTSSTIKAESTTIPMLFHGNPAKRSVPTTTKSKHGQTSNKYKLSQL
jgi:hypothetical protein